MYYMCKHRGTGEVRIHHSRPHEGIWEILKIGQGACPWSPTEINDLYYGKSTPDEPEESAEEKSESGGNGKPPKK
jgi:hypothetical protein